MPTVSSVNPLNMGYYSFIDPRRMKGLPFLWEGWMDGRTDGRRVTPPGRGQHNKQCEAGYTDLQPPMLLTSSI